MSSEFLKFSYKYHYYITFLIIGVIKKGGHIIKNKEQWLLAKDLTALAGFRL